MKFDRQKAFPYPVLRPYSDDYKDVDFQTTVNFDVKNNKIGAIIEYAISSEEILKEISNGNAEYVSIISCRDTYFRYVLRSSNKATEAEFDIGELRGEVRVDPYVVVRQEIISFQSPDINSEFGAGPFKFTVGDILAQDESQVIYIDRDLFKPVTSVFELVKRDELTGGEWSISFDQDHIQIGVSPKMKESIDDARNNTKNRAILLNSIYFASVMQSIEKLKDSPGEFDEYKWAKVIQMQAHNRNVDLTAHDAYLVAERLMKYPLAILDAHVFQGND